MNKKTLPNLNFPRFRFRVTDSGSDTGGGGQLRIWDTLRLSWLVLTPEEWVRQHLIRLLVEHMGVVPQLISQETQVTIQGMNQRADLVVFGGDGTPLLLAECKAPSVEIDSSVFAQAFRYNSVLEARYIMLTNGLKHFVYELMEDGEYAPLPSLPEL